MRNHWLSKASDYVTQEHRRQTWIKVVGALACLVVFCTAYMLILPALTMEERVLDCPEQVHQHTSACYDGSGRLTCGQEDHMVHVHTSGCWDASGALRCPFTGDTALDAHVHTDSCYVAKQILVCTQPESQGHVHDADCYTRTQGELICTETSEDHEHTDACYAWEETLTCTQEEGAGGHQHTAECYETETTLTCGKEGLHTHTDACYDAAGNLTCGQYQLHTHTASCYSGDGTLICRLLELKEHVHTDACYQTLGDLTDAEQAQVEAVIAQISALPSQEEITETMAGLADEAEEAAYLAQLTTQAKEAYAAYTALTEQQQAKVTNADDLLALEPLWSGEMLDEGADSGEPVRLFEYAKENGGRVEITISDSKGNLTSDPVTGEYAVTAGETYNVRVAYSGDELAKGKYYVTFASINDLAQSGNLTIKDNQGQVINAGTWYFEKKENDVVWLMFDITGDLSDHSNIILTADVTCKFDYVDKPMEFDGNVTVNIKHNEASPNTKVSKWANKWNSENSDTSKISWRSEIYGNSGSHIVGNTITDTITTENTHYYTEEDMEAGIQFEATKYKTESSFTKENIVESHYWTVNKGDNGLTWTESGWTYTVPEKITCTDCNEEITLGNDDWLYYLKYTSSVKPGLNGYTRYENKLSIDGDEATGWIHSGAEESTATVVKTGVYSHNNPENENDNLYANDTIDWSLTIQIPGAKAGKKYDYGWHLDDGLSVKDGNQTVKWKNLLKNVTVTADIGGRTYTVPEYGTSDAANSECPICWRNTSESSNGSHREIFFYSKCGCNEETCANWELENDQCGGKHGNGTFCECWSIEGDVTITFQYSTPAGDLTTAYGGRNAKLVNDVDLNNLQRVADNPEKFKSVIQSESADEVIIPGVFTKQLTHEPDETKGYLAEYTITINEAMADLSKMQNLTIEDTMTKTLGFLSLTLEIQAEDADGKTRELKEGEDKDYTKSYDTNVEGSNKLTITLNKKALGPYKYTLIYDTSVSGGGEGQGLTYKNDASVELFGKPYTVEGVATDVPSAVISAETYGATLYKYDKNDSDNGGLNGAKFGLYVKGENGQKDVKLHEYTTGPVDDKVEIVDDKGNRIKKGIVQVNTRPAEGVVLHPHVLYYLQELEAPEGYQLDSTKHYFWFCNNKDDIICSKSNMYGLPPYNGICIYSLKTNESTVDLKISNSKIEGGYELPSTGGAGAWGYRLGGLAVLACGLGYGLIRRGKEEKDD